MRKFVGVIGLILAMMVPACDSRLATQKAQETYEGKPRSEWIALLSDTSPAMQLDAVDALSHMKSKEAKDALRAAAITCTSTDAQLAALYETPVLSDDELLTVLLKIAQHPPLHNALGGNVFVSTPFVHGVERLKTKAKPLVPFLKNAESRMDQYERPLLVEMLANIGEK